MNKLRLATPAIFVMSVLCTSAPIPTSGYTKDGGLVITASASSASDHPASGEAAHNPARLKFGNDNSSNLKGRRADRVIATKVIEGTLVRFERGDYLWAVVKDSAGKERYFDMPDQTSAEYFLAEHKGKVIVITDQIVSRYIPEAGSRQRIDTMKALRYGNLTVANWWKQVRAKSTLAQLREKYDNLIEEYTVTP